MRNTEAKNEKIEIALLFELVVSDEIFVSEVSGRPFSSPHLAKVGCIENIRTKCWSKVVVLAPYGVVIGRCMMAVLMPKLSLRHVRE